MIRASKSRLNMRARCAQQFAFRYGLDMVRPPSAAMSFGSAWHDGAGVDYHHKSETGENLPVEDTVEHAVESLKERKPDTDWTGADFGEHVDLLADLQREYAVEVARDVHPIKGGVERKLEIQLGDDVLVTGYIDVVDGEGSIDLKSSAKRWAPRQALTALDPLIYTMDEPGVSVFKFHVGVKKEGGETQVIPVKVDENAKAGARAYVYHAAHEMQRVIDDPENPELALPTGFGGFMCNRRHCGYWRECQARWGLPIPE
jgi:hypothetical protein